MHLSRIADYALRACVALAGQERLKAKDLAVREGLPTPYLAKVVQTLRVGGLVQSERGPKGGFILARPASKITIREVIEAVQGEVFFRRCVSNKKRCVPKGYCTLHPLWRKMEKKFANEMGRLTIEDLRLRRY